MLTIEQIKQTLHYQALSKCLPPDRHEKLANALHEANARVRIPWDRSLIREWAGSWCDTPQGYDFWYELHQYQHYGWECVRTDLGAEL